MNKTNKCECKEASCKEGCVLNHTCKQFWCKECHPERYEINKTIEEIKKISDEYCEYGGDALGEGNFINDVLKLLDKQKLKLCNLYEKRKKDALADLHRQLNEQKERGDDYFASQIRDIIKMVEGKKKEVCCPESQYHDDYCCMEVEGYNQALQDIIKQLKQ